MERENLESAVRATRKEGRVAVAARGDATSLKNDGIQYRGRFESELEQLAGRIERPPFALYFLYYRRTGVHGQWT